MAKVVYRLDEIENKVMSGLKDFQVSTVNRIDYLFSHKQRRVLVSDEVGLGKTLIARGVVAKFAKLRYKENDPLVKIVYICSNSAIKPSEESVVVVSDSSQTTSVKNSVPVEEITEKWKKDGVVDYPDVNVFEQAVNNGEELAGKTVTFTVKGVRPDSILGYNLYGGEHLNFVSDEGIGINEGDEITVIVTDVKRVLTDSYRISYVLLDRKSK